MHKWHTFIKENGSQQKRPPIGKSVLVLCRTKAGSGPDDPHPIAVGYRKDAAGDRQCPYFVVPGIGGEVLAWCDCLPENFKVSDWPVMPNEKVITTVSDLFKKE